MDKGMHRRLILKSCAALVGVLAMSPWRALAAVWNKAAFEATQPDVAVSALTPHPPQASKLIDIIAPDFAENGAIVQIEVESRIPNTEAIAILAEKNPTSLIANFMFGKNTKPKIITRIKLAETGLLKVVVKAGDQYFEASRRVEVSIGGCG